LKFEIKQYQTKNGNIFVIVTFWSCINTPLLEKLLGVFSRKEIAIAVMEKGGSKKAILFNSQFNIDSFSNFIKKFFKFYSHSSKQFSFCVLLEKGYFPMTTYHEGLFKSSKVI
jgi:hypothetical protein